MTTDRGEGCMIPIKKGIYNLPLNFAVIKNLYVQPTNGSKSVKPLKYATPAINSKRKYLKISFSKIPRNW